MSTVVLRIVPEIGSAARRSITRASTSLLVESSSSSTSDRTARLATPRRADYTLTMPREKDTPGKGPDWEAPDGAWETDDDSAIATENDEKVERAKKVRGMRFLHILSPCPPGWKTASESSIKLGRMAVQTRVFPMLEVEDGAKWRFTMDHAGDPVEPYIRAQGRFSHLPPEAIEGIQAEVDAKWELLENRVRYGT